ncbi:MAG: hypothetical protein CYPHOPRED_005509 [Cyphobasidiales sp. Tagirdzhanova-0007]|nr:MAG: hypothetical protein CYPHOPRED_005509 [Cyphobasidiales sp. Tagirdzhanova-0007]
MKQVVQEPAFAARWPGASFPAFESYVHKDLYLTEGSAICEYIGSLKPESGLIPSDPVKRAQITQWSTFADMDIIGPLTAINKAYLHITPYDEAMADGIMSGVDGRFRRLEAYLEGRKFLIGNSITLADITMATCLQHAYMKFFYPEKRVS